MVAWALRTKTVTLVRHGESAMNVAMPRWGSKGFVDPGIAKAGLRDAALTEVGLGQAHRLRRRIDPEALAVDVVVASPLTRALQTAHAAFADLPAARPKVVTALAAERVYLSSELGTPVDALETRWDKADFDFTHLRDHHDREWWEYLCPGEPREAFLGRMDRLLEWIDRRDEAHIALVCHWGVINCLTGASFENCELRSLPFTDLRVRDMGH